MRTGTRRRGGPRSLTGVVLATLAALTLLLTGCSSIPTSGPVGTIPAQNGAGPVDAPNFNVVGPTGGESPEAIVSGFFKAGLDSSDNYAVAREFLTERLAGTWDATAGALIEDTDPEIESVGGDTRQRATLRVTREVDAEGLRTDHPAGEEKQLDFRLTKVGGEWRISQAPDGIVVDSANFDLIFSAVTLNFYSDRQFSHLVPDVRWMVRRQGRTAMTAAALLAGPAPYLKGAVHSAFPDGAKLSRPSVPVEDAVATVDVPESVVAGADDETRRRMVQQLEATLVDGVNITSVQLTADQTPVDVGGDSAPTVPPATVDSTVVGIAHGDLVRYTDGTTTLVQGGDKLGSDPSDPTAAPARDAYAVLRRGRTSLVALAPDGARRELATGTRLLAPSYDSSSWIWSGEAGSGSGVTAYRAAGNSRAEFSPSWLKGVDVTGLRVSGDGTRLAMITRDELGAQLVITGIVRDDDGRPTGLAQPLRIGLVADATRVVWAADDTVVAYATGRTTKVAPEEVDLSMHHQSWPLLLGLTSLAVGPGTGNADLAVNADGIYQRDNYTWVNVGKDVKDLSYRG